MFLASWPGGSWEATLKIAIVIAAIYIGALWLTLVFWTYRDIRQRTRDPIVQTVAVLLVLFFFLPGHWIYLILRPRYTMAELYERSLEEEALLQELEDQKACPNCKRRVVDDYLICPSCRTQLKEPCRQCSKPLSYAWVACPFCGLEKPPRENQGPRPARPRRDRERGSRPAPAVGGLIGPTPLPTPGQARKKPDQDVKPTTTAAAKKQAPERPAASDPFAKRPAVGEEPMIGGASD